MPRSEAHADVFLAIADTNRRRLLDLLADTEQSVGALVAGSGISYSLASQHLTVLRKAGLVTRRSEGRQRFYRLDGRPLRNVYDWTARYQTFWSHRLSRLRAHLEQTEGQ